MRRRTITIREAKAGRRAAAASPGLRASLVWISIVAVLLIFGCSSAHAQSGARQAANPAPTSPGAPAAASARARAATNSARMPLSFEQNRGQSDARVKFLARGPGYTLFLTNNEAVFAFPSRAGGREHRPGALRLRFEHSDAGAQIVGQSELPGKTNYFPSGDRSTWHTGIPNYSGVEYREIYPGVDAVFHGTPRRLEFDFDVAPGADPSKIALDFAGGRVLRLDSNGNIVLGVGKSSGGEVTLDRPVMYQQIAGVRREIAGRFVLRGPHRIGFRLGKYDRTQPLVIDPTLSYSTYLGGSAASGNVPSSYGQAVAVDSSGNAYVTGGTISSNFPTPSGTGGASAPQSFVSKFGPDGTLLYTSFTAEYFTVWGIAVDSTGSAYLGGTALYGIATTPGAYDGPSGGGERNLLGVIKLSTDGSAMVYAAQIGLAFPSNENLFGMGIAVDSSGSAYIAASTNLGTFPTTPGAYQSSCWSTGCTAEATVTKLSPDGSSLVYSTLLGGHGGDYATGIAVDANGDAFVTGATGSTDFPTTTGVLQPTCSSSNSDANEPPDCADTDVFVSELNPGGSALVYSTYLGNGINLSNGADSQIGIALDAAGNAYIAGSTDSTVFTNGLSAGAGPTNPGPPVTCGTEYPTCPDDIDYNFLAKVAPGGNTLAYLGFLGGYSASPVGAVNGYTFGDSVAVDSSGNAYLTGVTTSNFFPVTSDAYQSSFREVWPYAGSLCSSTSDCGSEAYLSILNTELSGNSSLVYSTYFGAATLELNPTLGTGIAVDGSGNAWLTGSTASSTFPTTQNAAQSSCALASSSPSYCDDYAFVTEFATATTTPAAAITVVSGGGQSAAIGSQFANPLVVKVTDASYDPVSGALVTFSVPSSGASASLSSTTGTTASDGTASVTATANGIASSTAYTVSATVAGVTTPATFSLTNTPAATSLIVTPSALSLIYGQPVTITAAISPANVNGSAPTGSVAFYDGTTALTPDSAVANATASYSVTVPAVGSHTYGAQYLGNTNFAESALTDAASAVVVGKAAVNLAGPATQPVEVQHGTAGSIAVTISGQYSGSGIDTPSGGLSYSVSGNAFGPGTVLVANGSASIPVPGTVAAGSYTVTVSYAGDANYNADSISIQLVVSSSSGPIEVSDPETITVNDSATQVQIIDVSDPETVHVTDTVSVQAGYTIGGSVAGLISGQSVALLLNGSNSLTISQNGSFTFNAVLANSAAYQVTIAAQPTGETCTLAGASGVVASSNVTDVEVTCAAPTTTALVSSATTSSAGYSVTFTATVASSAGTPTGNVTLYDGNAALATVALSGGIASYSTTSLPAGSDSVTAVYAANGEFLGSTSASLDETISTFHLNFSSTAGLDLFPGQSATLTMTVTPLYGSYSDPITFSATGLPPGATAVFSSDSLTPGSSPVTASLTITDPPLTSRTDPGFRRIAPVLFALVLPLAGLYRRRSAWRSLFMLLLAVVALGSVTELSGCGNSGFFNQAPKTYIITVTGSSGTVQQSTTLTLTVE